MKETEAGWVWNLPKVTQLERPGEYSLAPEPAYLTIIVDVKGMVLFFMGQKDSQEIEYVNEISIGEKQMTARGAVNDFSLALLA